jgi:DNA-binding transcriptional LysR family regulator
MDLRQLEYFVAVAEEQNFTRAAERVHISQSGVSAQIRQLERELGTPLIDRSGRRATLTDAGTAALEHARAALAAAEAVRGAVDDITGLVRGRLEVGMVTGCTITPLFDALAEFRHAHPGIEIALSEGNSDRLIERVRTGVTDLALIGAAAETSLGLEAMVIVSEQLVAAVSSGHPLAGLARPTLADVVGHPLICLPQGTGVRTVLDQACSARGLRPDIALQASAPEAVADLAARGLGVAILSESMPAARGSGLETVAISGMHEQAVLALVWKPGVNPALRELVQRCRAAFGQLS